MATFEALRLVRQARSVAPDAIVSAEATAILDVRVDDVNHDFEAAFALDELVPPDAAFEGLDFYQVCIEACIFAHRPVWVRTIPHGRKSFVQKLGTDEAQCFAASGLMDEPPTGPIIEWWDRIAGRTRSLSDQEKMRQARAAEKLSLEYERERLRSLGIGREPVWMAIEDNWAGYDILSYDGSPHSPTSRMIEVKSTTASPLRFFVTRNEWAKCVTIGRAYEFHIWDMKTERLFVRTGEEIAQHVPDDRGGGRWTNLEIKIGG